MSTSGTAALVLASPRRATAAAATVVGALLALTAPETGRCALAAGPYERQVEGEIARLAAAEPPVRQRAAEALGFLRSRAADTALRPRLSDASPGVRRQAALSLGWCGGRGSVAPLLKALDDPDWTVRQAARVALENLTGMDFPFDARAPEDRRERQAEAWRTWWSGVPAGQTPPDVLALLADDASGDRAWTVTVSSAYRGPPEAMIDGELAPAFWQTKNVKPPQWCRIDLGTTTEVRQVAVHQYRDGMCMTECEIGTSLDGVRFDPAAHLRHTTPVDLVVEFPPRAARFVRIASLASQQPVYPTTFREVRINGESGGPGDPAAAWRRERGLRALGALGGQGATEAILATLGTRPPEAPVWRPAVRAGIRSAGQLHAAAGVNWLIGLLANPMWARCAAEALGDTGDARAVGPLLTAYARFAKRLDGRNPPEVPADDLMTFPSEDRMLETPYWIAHALCRLPLNDSDDLARLRELAPLILANLPGDLDTFLLYRPEAGHRLTRHLLETADLCQEAAEQAFVRLGQPRRVAAPRNGPAWPLFDERRTSTWLPCACTAGEDVPRLLALVQHTNGWVRLNAAKALAWIGDPAAVEPLAATLAAAKPEAAYGWSTTWKQEEFNDPCPRWREGLLRALGSLQATQHVGLIANILNDEDSVLDVRHAAAEALADLGTPEALAVLQRAAQSHPFGTVRQVARDAVRMAGLEDDAATRPAAAAAPRPPSPAPSGGACIFGTNFTALLFIRGDNDLPNTPQTVEQADRWRQTYAVTDEGPVYRPGDNLYVLSPPRPDGNVTPLTRFADGWIGEPELSWDARRVVFTRREKSSLWWHVWTMNIDGTDLRQITHGPYHHVGPAFLPDGRIVCATSRTGIRDEYHGYPCTALYVMNPDGGDLHPIATNIGRDAEPALLPDGRIAFSRLEVFYSRNKTELTLHAAMPDGTRDVVLYGPERRQFWRDLDHGAKDPADVQEAPLTHRVLRVTQPQPMPDGRIVVCTQGGLTAVGPGRTAEHLLAPDFKTRAYTTPVPLADGTLLCATTLKTPDRKKIDLGLHRLDPRTGELTLVYNDPSAADYEARPILARIAPPAPAESGARDAYRGRFLCASVFASQDPEVARRGRLVRLVEGVPVVGRHETHTGSQPVWKNHGGTMARVLGTAPLAADGSFFLEIPADRLVHLQVLDSDRRVIGNQLTWIYARPDETRSCTGCHEIPDTTAAPARLPLALHGGPLSFLPSGGEFTYRAKAWFKGSLPPEIEERTRTVHAINLLAR